MVVVTILSSFLKFPLSAFNAVSIIFYKAKGVSKIETP